MAEVPTIGDSIDEPQAHVTDQLLGDPQWQICCLVGHLLT